MLATSTHAALADQYLDRLAFGWQARNRALDSHVLDLADLSKRDQILQSCARALTLTGRGTAELMQARLKEPLTRGELFAMALHAIGGRDAGLHRACVALVQAVATLRAAYASALEWAAPQNAWWALNQWSQAPIGQSGDGGAIVAVMALIAARAHPQISAQLGDTPWWRQIMHGTQPSAEGRHAVDIALMQFALASAHPHAGGQALALLQSPLAQVRCIAAEVVWWQALQPPSQGAIKPALDTLLALATHADSADSTPHAGSGQATQALACRRHADFDAVLSTLKAQPRQLGLYLQALGWSGRSQAVPELMAYLEHPLHARAAGAALSMLTGSLPARDGWQAPPQAPTQTAAAGEAEPDSATIPSAPAHADLPPPDPAGFARWWSKHKQDFADKTTWLAGLPETPANLVTVLQRGKLAWRKVAARRLHALQGDPVLNTSAPTLQQHQWLAKHATPPTKRPIA